MNEGQGCASMDVTALATSSVTKEEEWDPRKKSMEEPRENRERKAFLKCLSYSEFRTLKRASEEMVSLELILSPVLSRNFL